MHTLNHPMTSDCTDIFSRIQSAKNLKFQSLFCWISFSDKISALCSDTVVEFQSLFCWISFSDWELKQNGLKDNTISFNPCFAGFPFRTKQFWSKHGKTSIVSILVLLDFLFGLFPISLDSNDMLVSILVLLDFLFGHRYRASLCQRLVFQSLFCWISFSDNHKKYT